MGPGCPSERIEATKGHLSNFYNMYSHETSSTPSSYSPYTIHAELGFYKPSIDCAEGSRLQILIGRGPQIRLNASNLSPLKSGPGRAKSYL